MSDGATPYGHVQPDPLAFLDQPIGAFGTVATTVPPSYLDLGETSASNDSAAQHLPPPAWVQPPRPEDTAFTGYSTPQTQLQYAPQLPPLAAQQLGVWQQDGHTTPQTQLQYAPQLPPLAAPQPGHWQQDGHTTLQPQLHYVPQLPPLAAPQLGQWPQNGYVTTQLQPHYTPQLLPPANPQPGHWQQDGFSTGASSHDTGHDSGLPRAGSSMGRGSPAELDRRSSSARTGSSSGHDSLKGALAAVLHEDDSEEGQEAQLTKAAANRMRQHNRSAQRRYREKQRAKLVESDEKVEELTEQIKTLKMQKESLALRNGLLEKLVGMRAAQDSSGGASVVQAAPAAWWLDAQTRLLLEDMLGLGPTITISVRPGLPPATLMQQQVVDMEQEEYTRTWQQYINAFAEALIAPGADDPQSPAGHRMEALLAEAFRFQCTMALTRPEWAHALHMHTAMTGASSRQAGAAEALRMLNLRPRQRTVLLRLRKLYVRNLASRVKRREQLTAQIQAACNAGTDSRLTGVVKADDLRDVLREEHSLWCQFQLCVWRQVLSPFQAASLMLQSHPSKADTMAVLEVLAAESGKPSYAQLMAEAATQPDADIRPLDAALVMMPHCLEKDDDSDD